MRIVVVVQARTGSQRLPGKILLPLAGKPLLQRQLERIQAATVPFELVVATTHSSNDDPVRELCKSLHIKCFSGHPTDLLDRHYQSCQGQSAPIVLSKFHLIVPSSTHTLSIAC